MNLPQYFAPQEFHSIGHASGRDYAAFGDIFRLLSRNRLILVAATAAALTLGAVYFVLAPVTYRAQAQLLLDPRLPQIFREASDLGLNVDTGQIETHMVVLKSRTIALAVVNRLDLPKDLEFQKQPPRFGFLPFLSGAQPGKDDPVQTAADIFLSKLRIEREGISQVINVAFQSSDRSKAALIANEAALAYVQYLIDARAEAARSAAEWMESRLQQLRLQMNAAAKRTQNFRASSESATMEELQLSAETYRKVYQDFYSAFTEAVQRESYPVSTVRLVTAASPPPRAYAPNLILVFGLAAALGMAAGLLLAILRDSRAGKGDQS
jgi:uncharacterized protein involved in exopolysaccharide biosynthesis